MKRLPRPDELHLWARVTATVHPATRRHAPPQTLQDAAAEFIVAMTRNSLPAKPAASQPAGPGLTAPALAPKLVAARPHVRRQAAPEAIEPGRMRRLTRDRDPMGPRLDLHGLDQDQARSALTGFLHRAQDDGWRAALVITGKGSRGDGILRRMVPEWLAAPGLRGLVSGVSEAHRRHGGQGALYVALKRRPKT